MSRCVPIVIANIFVAAALSAEAHPAQLRPTTESLLPSRTVQLTAFSGLSVAQADDVAAKVKARLQADPDLSSHSSEITVTGAAGIVTLEGTVPTAQIRAKIGELVLKTEGVTKVNNKVKLAKK